MTPAEVKRWEALHERFPLIVEELVADGLTLEEVEACVAPEPYRSPVHRAPVEGVRFLEFVPKTEA